LFDARIRQGHGARSGRRRLLRAQAFWGDRGLRRDRAERAFRHRVDILGLDVAGDHQRRIVGRVEALVECQRVLAAELLDLLAPADHWAAIGMIEIQRGHHLFAQPRVWVVGDTHVVLFEHHVALRQHVLVLQDQAGHAIGLEFHHLSELLARHALEVAGVVGRGEGVLVAADPQHGLGEFTLRMRRRALEHQMLEKMRKARFARGLVGGADLVPDHLRDDRGAMIGDHHHLHAIGEREGGRPLRGHGLGLGCLRDERRRQQQGQCCDGPQRERM